MNIGLLLSTEERVNILRGIIYRNEQLSVGKVAKDTKLSKGLVSKYLNLLAKEGVLKRTTGKFQLQENLETKTLRIFLNLSYLHVDVLKRFKFVKSAGIYGSFAKGENREDSDIDMWLLISQAGEEQMAKLTGELRRVFGNLKPLYLTLEKIRVLRKEDPVFYHSLIFGSITIYGGGIEAI
jgi:predicted nucleotidyltransferase